MGEKQQSIEQVHKPKQCADPRHEATGVRRRSGNLVAVAMVLTVTALALAGAGDNGFGVPSAMANPQEANSRMLPLKLTAPPTARVGQATAGISVRLNNPGAEAPDARLRLVIHEVDHRSHGGHHELSPSNVRVEVQEGGSWKPVLLGVVDGGVMGAIGGEGAAEHRERHKRGGFSIPEGFDKRWPLRVTFDVAGTFTLVVSVSPDNGSRHLAQPAHTTIEVQ